MEHATLLGQLSAIPQEAVQATVAGINMQVIDITKKDELLQTDPTDTSIHECILANGNFLFVSRNGKLEKLYKVV